MSGEPLVTIVGNIGSDPELRFTPGGKAVCNFGLANTPRHKVNDEWVDGDPTWFQCAAWETLGENVAESILSGMSVIVVGYLHTRFYETREGVKGKSLELRVEAIGPNLRWATAKVTRAQRAQGGGGGQQQRQQGQQAGGQQQGGRPAPANDPWANAPVNDPWANQPGAEPPF